MVFLAASASSSRGAVGATIAIRPDTDGIYVGDGDTIVECDSDLRIRRQIPLTDLCLGEGPWKCGPIAASHARICIVAWKGDDPFRAMGTLLVSWQPSKDLSTRFAVPLSPDVLAVHIDEKRHRALLHFHDKLAYCDLSSGRLQDSGLIGRWSVVDYDVDRGILLTGDAFAGQAPTIVAVHPDNGRRTAIGEGAAAVWGPEDLIYYSLGASELWQCRSDGSAHEPVVVVKRARGGPMGDIRSPSTPLILLRTSVDRTLLSFAYEWGGSPLEDDRCGTVLLDVRKKEFMMLPGVRGLRVSFLAKAKPALEGRERGQTSSAPT